MEYIFVKLFGLGLVDQHGIDSEMFFFMLSYIHYSCSATGTSLETKQLNASSH